MTKAIFRESVWIKLNGGGMNPNSSVQRVDIDAFMPLAVNYAVTAGRNTNIQIEGDRDYPSCFYGVFNDLDIDRTGAIPKITLPKGYVPLPSNQGIRFLSDNCGNFYAPLTENDRRNAKYYVPLMIGQYFYYPIGQYDLELWGINPLIEKVNGTIIVRTEDLDDDDELPIQSGLETMAIQVCFEYVSGQRSVPAQKNINKTDLNVA